MTVRVGTQVAYFEACPLLIPREFHILMRLKAQSLRMGTSLFLSLALQIFPHYRAASAVKVGG